MRWPLSLLVPALVVGNAVGQELDAASGRLRAIRISTGDVFPPEEAKAPLAGLFDALHWTTRTGVVERELWFAPGDTIDAATAAEVERNLRALGLFAEVTARLVPTGTPGEVDLEITTRDRFTFNLGAGASFVGGITGVRGGLGESNLFGLGDRLAASFARNSEDEYRFALAYTDLHVLDTWHTGTVRGGRTDDGDFFGLELRRPIKHLRDVHTYGVALSYDESEVEYFRDAEVRAELADVRSRTAIDYALVDGPRDRRRTLGLVLIAERNDYGPVRGPLASDIRVPGDTGSVFFGPTARLRLVDGFRKVTGIDTLGFVQDLELGAQLGITAGARYRDEAGRSDELQPEVSLDAAWAGEPFVDVFTRFDAATTARWSGSDVAGHETRLAARAFVRATEQNTLAAAIRFDAVDEDQDLLRELLLGEDVGLRGYRARQFAGTHRLRLNLENRFDTGLELWTLRFGVVAFFDSAWLGRGSELGRPWTAAGLGLRIGSPPLLGGGVLRIDVAQPLDDVEGENDGLRVSVSVGQVFGFDR